MVRLLALLQAGFRWWMLPLLILLVGGFLALLLLSSLSGVAPSFYTAF